MRKLFILSILALGSYIAKAQTYADQVIVSGPCNPIVAVVCPSGVENPTYAVDQIADNYAMLKSNLGTSLIQSTAYIKLGFSKPGLPGSEIGIVIEKTDQSLNADVVDQLTVIIYDTLGNEVARRQDLGLQDVGALGGSSSRQVIRLTAPFGEYKIGSVQVELTAVANVLQNLALYGVYHNLSCPPVLANTLAGAENCSNPDAVVDGDSSTTAQFSLVASLGNVASLTVGYNNPAKSGDYMAFEVSKNNTLLQASLVGNLSITLYDKDSVQLFSKADFSTADLVAADALGEVLGSVVGSNGTSNNKYIVGFTIPSTVTSQVAFAKLELESNIGLLLDLNIHGAFYYSQMNGIRVTANRVGLIGNVPVILTADAGFNSYSWSNNTSGQSTTVTEEGTYTVTATRFDGCQMTGSSVVRRLDCGTSGRVFADSLYDFGSCDPQVLLVCPSGVNNPEFAADSAMDNFATMNSSLGVSLIESTAFLDLSFNKSGDPGSDIGVVIQDINQNLNADVVDNLTVIVYGEDSTEVYRNSGVNLSNVGALSGTSNMSVLNLQTPLGNYRIKRIRVEMVGVANVLQSLGVYGMFYDCACPAIAATSVDTSTNTTNPELAIDADQSNFAVMSIPVSLGQSAILQVGFSNNVTGGDYVGFQVEPDDDLLSLGLIDNFEVSVYDQNGIERQRYSDFSLADVVAAEKLGGTLGGLLGGGGAGTTPYVIGFQSDTGNYRISSIRLTVNANIGVLTNLRVYNAFAITQLAGVKIISSDTVICKGSDVTLTAPFGFDDYKWSTGETSQTITVSEPGQYSVTVGRTDGCSLAGSYFLKSRAFSATFTGVQPNCGQSTGSVGASVVGGSGDYSYLWSNGDTTNSIDNVTSGTYSIVVTDKVFGCIDTFSYTLNNNDVNFIGYVRNAECGMNNGAIFVTLPQGATIVWSTGQTTAVIRNLAPGKYTATVTLVSGCTGSQTFTVLNYKNLGLSAVVTNANCILDNGAIDLSVDSVGTFSYLWSNDSTTQDISNLAPDLYSVIVTRAQDGCQDGLRRSVSDVGGPIISLVDIREETCARQQNGRIEIAYTPNDTSFDILWNNGATTRANELLGPGIYKVFVTNNSGCQSVRDFELVARDSVNIQLFGTNSVCTPPFNGELMSMVTEGRSPYSYLYSTGDTTKDLANQGPGDYQLQVTDFNGCVTIGEGTIGRDPSCDKDKKPLKEVTSQLVTPNDDSYNEHWRTELIVTYPSNEVEIFSRDGVRVFETKNYENKWAGTYRDSNVKLPDGTYFWVFRGMTGKEIKEFRGFVVIKQ